MTQPIDASFSAVVVSYQTGPVLDACLTALLDAPLCHQIVLVNNGNSAAVLLALVEQAKREPKLTLIDGQGNIGFGRGCNLGARHATQAMLVFVNPDCVIDVATLPVMATALEHHPTALVGGALRNQDGTPQRGCRRGELTLWSALVSFAGLGRPGLAAGPWRDFNRTSEPMPLELTEMPVISGALMAITADAFRASGGFDPAFFLHVEDVDLCRRTRESGRSVLFVPQATARHIGATSGVSSWAIERAKIVSFGHYFWKNARTFWGYLGVLILMPMLALALVLRMVSDR